MSQTKKYDKLIQEMLSTEGVRLDWILRKLIQYESFDKFLLACSNTCVFKSNEFDPDSKQKDWWIKQAKIFHSSYELYEKMKKKGISYDK